MGAYPAYDPMRKYPVMRERNDLPVMRTRNDLRRLPVMRLAQDGGPATLVDPSEDNPSARALPGYAPAPAVGEVISRAPGAESAALPSDGPPPQAGAMRADAYADSLPTINPAYASKVEGASAASPYEKAVADYNALLAASPENTNSRGVGALRMAADASRREAQQSNSLGRVLGAAIGGGVTGLLDKSADEQTIDRPAAIARAQARVQLDAAAEQERERRDSAAAAVNERNSIADWNRARPAVAELQRRQSALQREIGNRMKEPRAFDANDAYDSDLAARAQAAQVSFDPKMFGDFKNPATMEILDPSDPSGVKKTRLVLDRASGRFNPVQVNGQGVTTGYVRPVGADGMTASERTSANDREQAQTNLERQRAIQNELSRNRIDLSRGRLSLSQAAQDDRFSAQTRRELGDANKLVSEAERWQQAANDIGSRTTYVDPNDGQTKESRKADNQRDLFAARAASLRQQAVQNYGYLLDGDGHMTTGQFKGLFPSLQGNWSGEAQRLGVTLSDDQLQGPVTRSPLRRSAPARSAPASAAPPPAQVKRVSRARFRAKYPQFNGQPDSAVDAAITSSGGQPIP